MECTFSQPIDLDSSVTFDWEYSQMDCEYTQVASVEAEVVNFPPASSTSAKIDIASDSAIAKGIYDITFVIYIIGFVVVLYCGFKLGSWIYRR